MRSKPDHVYIVADDREFGGHVAEQLARMDGVHVRVRRLSVGDYRVDDSVLFERKTLDDFNTSLVDGRLFRQMIRIANSSFTGVMVLEGSHGDLTKTGVSREAVQGALITISLTLGIPVLRSRDPRETAKIIVYAARQSQAAARGPAYRYGYRPKGKRKRQIFILQGLPGIGVERAARLLDRFGSVEGVICAGSEDLQSVEGIGEHTADKIRSTVSEGGLPYGNDMKAFLLTRHFR